MQLEELKNEIDKTMGLMPKNGEGCVPETAELAFRTLYPELMRKILK